MTLYDILRKTIGNIELHIFDNDGDETILTDYENISMCRARLPITHIMAIDNTIIIYAEETEGDQRP